MQRPAYDSFLVNQTVELRCSAQVGSLPAYYLWQYRHTGRGTEKESVRNEGEQIDLQAKQPSQMGCVSEDPKC